LVFIYFISFGGFVALTAYLPVFNTEYHGTSGRVAGTFTASYSILASLSRTATGKHVDKIGGGKCTAMGLGWILLGSVLLGSSSPMDVHTFYQYGGLFFMGFGSGFTNAAVYKWIPKVEPTGKA
jgi:NNP family nitrate/nitrite transporter-like MFS transporter